MIDFWWAIFGLVLIALAAIGGLALIYYFLHWEEAETIAVSSSTSLPGKGAIVYIDGERMKVHRIIDGHTVVVRPTWRKK